MTSMVLAPFTGGASLLALPVLGAGAVAMNYGGGVKDNVTNSKDIAPSPQG